MRYKSKNRHKYDLKYHIIFVCKYRKDLLVGDIVDHTKQLSFEAANSIGCIIKSMEADKNHIHYLIEIPPTISVSKVVKAIKQYTTFHLWKNYRDFLSSRIWGDNTFWTDGYFVSTIGQASEDTIKNYIENQGK